jgi:hypothetical protein
MVLHPEVQMKAISELDALTGQDRLPKFDDRPHLPYIEAVVKECIRWHTVAPTGEGYPRYLSIMLIFLLIIQPYLIVLLRMTYIKDTSYLKAPWSFLIFGGSSEK